MELIKQSNFPAENTPSFVLCNLSTWIFYFPRNCLFPSVFQFSHGVSAKQASLLPPHSIIQVSCNKIFSLPGVSSNYGSSFANSAFHSLPCCVLKPGNTYHCRLNFHTGNTKSFFRVVCYPAYLLNWKVYVSWILFLVQRSM